MTWLPGDSRGATLIEQLFSLLLGAVMIVALYGFYRAELFHRLSLEAKISTLEDARGALDIIVRDLRNAGSWGSGNAPPDTGGVDDPDHDADLSCNRVYAATSSMIHIQMDLNGNGTCADSDPRENIRYELAGPTATCPGAKIIRRNGDCLIANVVTPAAGRLFSYYDEAGADLGDTPPRQAIKQVRIAFAVIEKNPDPRTGGNLTSSVATTVEFRN